MQVFWTVVSGVFVYVIGQLVLHFVLEPIKEFNKQRGDTTFLLLFYRAKITNANIDEKVEKEIKKMGAALISTMAQIPFYQILSSAGIFGLPIKQNVFKAAQELNGIAWPVGQTGDAAIRNYEALKLIAKLLNIQTNYA